MEFIQFLVELIFVICVSLKVYCKV